MILVCCKTGRFWRVHDHAHGERVRRLQLAIADLRDEVQEVRL
jgi:hypothetical protein